MNFVFKSICKSFLKVQGLPCDDGHKTIQVSRAQGDSKDSRCHLRNMFMEKINQVTWLIKNTVPTKSMGLTIVDNVFVASSRIIKKVGQ